MRQPENDSPVRSGEGLEEHKELVKVAADQWTPSHSRYLCYSVDHVLPNGKNQGESA